MFFRRKKKKEESEEPAPARAATPATPSAPAASSGPPSTQFLTGEAGEDRRTVQVLLEAIAQVSESRDLEALLTDIVDRSVEITGAERGLLILREPGTDTGLEVRVSRSRGKKAVKGEIRFSTSVANKVLGDFQPVLATVHSESEALELGRSVYDLKLRAVMCVPLASAEETGGQPASPPKGVLYVDSRAATRQFQQRDLALFAALAQHISIAMENARLHIDSVEKARPEQERELMGAIQRDMMPGVPRDLPGWELHGWYGPAEAAAGDFYDFVKARDGSLALVVGDVTGHGIGPALISSSAQASLRSYLRLLSEPGEVVSLLNQDLCDRVEDGRFLTLFMGMLAPDGSLRAVNGGHSLPFLWRKATGEIETLPLGGPALGMIPDENYEANDDLRLEEGDVLLVYTDGLIEARPPDQPETFFGEEGAKKILSDSAAEGADASTIAMRLVEAAMRLSNQIREDDITVVVARRTSGA